MVGIQSLAHGWEVTPLGDSVPEHLRGRSVPATVPCSGHTALRQAGLIPDPYLGTAERELAWMHEAHWVFRRDLGDIALDAPHAELVFEGLDTFAQIRLDGTELARSENMHRQLRVPIPSWASPRSQLEITFAPALHVAHERVERLGTRPAAYPHPYYMVRKMACSFGWDWGPDLQAAGIWRPARVETWARGRLGTVRPIVRDHGGGVWEVEVDADVIRGDASGSDTGAWALRCSIEGEAVREPARCTIPLDGERRMPRVQVRDPLRWHPHDRGVPHLALLSVELLLDGTVVDRVDQRIGFRTVRIDQSPDEHGTAFTLIVNGEPMFVRGFNWIPDDHLIDRITRDRLRERLLQARQAHANLIRVWGGGTYESDDFYDLCDELGLLVWQDVALACAGYPESEPLRSEILAEVGENAVRLGAHPSLALWCGGNENVWGFPQWRERGDIDDETDWGRRYVDDWLPELLAELDPTRPYLPNSPFSPRTADGQERWPNDAAHGVHHQWDVWNKLDYTAYRDTVPRFCAEFGYQGPPNRAVLDRAFREDAEPVSVASPAFGIHQKATDGAGKLARGMAPHLGRYDEFDDWHIATQLMQATAIRYALEHYRSHWPQTAGAVVWQLNDCWPAVSWSAIDSDGAPKPLWHVIRRAFADRITTLSGQKGRAVRFVNDSDAAWHTDYAVRRESLDGRVLASTTGRVEVPPRAVAAVELPATLLEDAVAEAEIIVLATDLGETPLLLTEPTRVRWLPDPVRVTVEPHPVGWLVEVQARSAVFGLTLLPDLMDAAARVDDAAVDMPAGGTARFLVRTSGIADPAVLTARPVLRWLGEIVDRRARD